MTVETATSNTNVLATTGPSSPIGAQPINVAALSAEGLMFYCQNQLGAIDTDIKAYMANQQKNLQVKAALTKLKNAIGKHTPPKSKAGLDEITQAYKQAYKELKQLDADGALLNAVGKSAQSLGEGLQKGWPKHFPNIKNVSYGTSGQTQVDGLEKIVGEFTWYESESKAFYEGLGNEIGQLVEDVKGNAELQMIQLQSLVSARQTAVQLTTNIMNKVDQTLSSVVNNIK